MTSFNHYLDINTDQKQIVEDLIEEASSIFDERDAPTGDTPDTPDSAGASAEIQNSVTQKIAQKIAQKKAELLRHPSLWQAGKLRPASSTFSTGYPALDAELSGGWPEAGIAELLHDTPGIGELQLLLPAMRELSQTQNRWIVWINPPHLPCATALRAAGVDVNKILLIHPRTAEEAIWALEKSLQSGGSSMVLCWFGQGSNSSPRHRLLTEQMLTASNSRRLTLAAKQGNTLGCLFRAEAAQRQSSMASLRLLLERRDEALTVHICKRPGGWPISDLEIELTDTPARQRQQQRTINEQLLLWRHSQLPATSPSAPIQIEGPTKGQTEAQTEAQTRAQTRATAPRQVPKRAAQSGAEHHPGRHQDNAAAERRVVH